MLPVVRILIADDHEILRYGLRQLIERRSGWVVCGEARDGREAIELATRLAPGIAILDVAMPEMNGLEATRGIAARSPGTRILLLTANPSAEIVSAGLACGAHGLLLKADAASQLIIAIEGLLAGRSYFSAQSPSTVVDVCSPTTVPYPLQGETRLSPREREVVRLVVGGKTSKEVGRILGISPKTASAHRANVMRKLGIHSVVELVHYAMRDRRVRA
jgi:DNA-binding NarL/FixJ family response regulator